MHTRAGYLLCLFVLPLGGWATAPTCNVSPVSPSPPGASCNQQGKVRSPACITTTTSPSQSACRDLCLSNPTCASFSYGPGKTCKTYKKTAKGSTFEKCNSGTYFWDKACYSKTCSTCSAPQKACNGNSCVNTQTDGNNCGLCGNVCKGGTTCVAGSCACPADQFTGLTRILCSGNCTDTQTDANNCGSCGTNCGGGVCVRGHCACPTDSSGIPRTLCNGRCINTQSDVNNCGICGTKCSTSGFDACVGGVCSCSADQNSGEARTVCEGSCTNTQTDASNCGSCGTSCGSGGYCLQGACFCNSDPQSGSARTLCDNGCTDTQTDTNNCGSCGRSCGDGLCMGGNCACAADQSTGNPRTLCNGHCADLQSDANNCGQCGNTCSTVDETCSNDGNQCYYPPCCLCSAPETSGAYSQYSATAGAHWIATDVSDDEKSLVVAERDRPCDAVRLCAPQAATGGYDYFNVWFDKTLGAWHCWKVPGSQTVGGETDSNSGFSYFYRNIPT